MLILLLSLLLRLIALLAVPRRPGRPPVCPMPVDRYHGRHRALVHIGGTHA